MKTVSTLALLCLLCGCNHHVKVTKAMSWECAPEYFMAQYPQAQPVRFRFVENPSFEIIVSGRHLCDELTEADKKVVAVEFDAWGDTRHGLRGFREISVDGRSTVDVGGWGSSGANGNRIGSHPLASIFN